RFGLQQKVAMLFDPTHDEISKLDDFLDEHGAHWGARRDIIMRARFALCQLVEATTDHGDVRGPFHIEASYDEFNMDLRISYDGEPFNLPVQRPSVDEICESEHGAFRLAGFMLRRNADRAYSERIGNRAVVRFHFDH